MASDRADTTATPYPDASDEPLHIIEANECHFEVGRLCTSRFRRLFNEIRARDAEIERLRLLAFAPAGDNHHNALACPHCNPEGRKFA